MDKKYDFISGDKETILQNLIEILDLRKNSFHPLAFINGEPKMGKNVFVGFLSEVNAKGGEVIIGDDCDIASFVSINVADSHKRCIEISKEIDRGRIVFENKSCKNIPEYYEKYNNK